MLMGAECYGEPALGRALKDWKTDDFRRMFR